MGIPNATHQVASNAVAALGNWISLHTGAGAGTTGANEASGGSYARQQATPWTGDGLGDNTGPQVSIPCAAGTYTESGIFSTQTGIVLAVPSGLSAAAAAGGSLTTGTTYYYKITGTNFAGETTASTEASATVSGSNLSVALTWSAVSGATGYNIYRGTASGSENTLVVSVGAVTSHTDAGGAGTSASLPGSNTASTFVGSAAFNGGPQVVTAGPISVSPTIAL
jgi:hypothetical protein